jgi:hypothetical protein
MLLPLVSFAVPQKPMAVFEVKREFLDSGLQALLVACTFVHCYRPVKCMQDACVLFRAQASTA